MKILAFESSCDETAVAVVEDGRRVLSDVIASQVATHAEFGGVVPEIASRKHIECIAALTEESLRAAGCTRQDIDAVAVTYAPGLIGAVLVGLNFAKSVAYGLGVPLIPVHHIRGHIAANYIAFPELEPPFLALAISGGNTMIVDVRSYTEMHILGATRDDAAGECFDKAARVLGLPYPGGRPMDELAQKSAGGMYKLPQAHVKARVVIAVAAVDDAGDNVFAGVLLHQVKTAVIIDLARHRSAGLQRPVAQMHHFFAPFLHIQHSRNSQSSQIAGLSAAFGVEGSGIQNHFKSTGRFRTAFHLCFKTCQVAIFIIELSCHGISSHSPCFDHCITAVFALQRASKAHKIIMDKLFETLILPVISCFFSRFALYYP